MKNRILSRKFLLAVAAFLAAFAGGAGGFLDAQCAACLMALSAGIYAACEAYVDGQSAKANGVAQLYTENVERKVTATSADRATVAATLGIALDDEKDGRHAAA